MKLFNKASLALQSLIAMAMLSIAGAANAALPAAIGTGITALQEDVLDLVDLVWPFVLAVSFAVLLFKFYKRVINKA